VVQPVTVTKPNPFEGYAIQKNNQSNVKGLLWGTAGSSLAATSLSLTVATVGAVIFSVSSAAATAFVNRYNGGQHIGAAGFLVFAGLAIVPDYLLLKLNGYCLRNAMHHFGPQYQIVKIK